MIPSGGFLVNQCKVLLGNRLYALVAVALLTSLPLTAWLAAALIALLTLRKGEEAGLQGLVVAVTINTLQLLKFVLTPVALFGSLVNFVPCLIAASVLRYTSSWRYALGSLFFLAVVAVGIVHAFFPELIQGQFLQIKALLSQHQDIDHVSELLSLIEDKSVDQTLLAHFLFSAQLVTIMGTSILSLMVARHFQARCFNPGGFKKEMLEFRSGKMALFLLMSLGIASYYTMWPAVELLPFVLMYFLAAGFSLACYMLTGKRSKGFLILLFLSLLIKPMVIFPIYIIFGSLDSLFNFRVYFLAKARQSV